MPVPVEFVHTMFRSSISLVAAVCLSQCSFAPVDSTVGPENDAFWAEEAVPGTTKIVISLEEQRIGLFKGHQLVGLSPISSGREGNDTKPGTFKVTEKDDDHRSSLYGAFVDASGYVVVDDVDVRKASPPPGTRFMGASMNWFMRFNGAIGMHQGYLPGYPASHGCIRLPGKMAQLFYSATPHGATVLVMKNAGLAAQNRSQAQLVNFNKKSKKGMSAGPAPTLRPVTPDVAGAPAVPMTLAPPKPGKQRQTNQATTHYLEGFGPQ